MNFALCILMPLFKLILLTQETKLSLAWHILLPNPIKNKSDQH